MIMKVYVRKIGKYIEGKNFGKRCIYLENLGNDGERMFLRNDLENRGFVDEGYLFWGR